jgi:hypothetical protein
VEQVEQVHLDKDSKVVREVLKQMVEVVEHHNQDKIVVLYLMVHQVEQVYLGLMETTTRVVVAVLQHIW